MPISLISKLTAPALALAIQTIAVAAGEAATNPATAEDPAALRWSTYVTAHSVHRLATDAEARASALPVLRSLRIDKVYLEVYRGGLVVSQAELVLLRDFFVEQGFGVVGGIATVPGGDFGVRANEGLGWFNWQNPKTQKDLTDVMRMAAGVFDVFIVDDFLCTGDTSPKSNTARGERSWSEYRRDLLTELSQRVFIDPARDVNPDITLIIKYPQWYDRFHLFGYDVARQPALFDRVWVGTETRGANTQRFGFVQPYEGFVNYRWLRSLAGGKLGGAWFDHGDCAAHDFVEQAWQSVLAGAPEIILFNYANLAEGHPGHVLLRRDFDALAQLAQAVRRWPVVGVGAYKPPNSDAGGDLYLMDFLGMLGIPLVPNASFPAESRVVFLPTQAAADPQIDRRVTAALREGRDLVLTAGFLASTPRASGFARKAGLKVEVARDVRTASHVVVNERLVPVDHGLALEADIVPAEARVLLEAVVGDRRIPFLTEHHVGDSRVAVLNTHTYSQTDFDAVGEVLLAPRPLGLLEIPRPWAAELRRVFAEPDSAGFQAPTKVTLQPLGTRGWFIQNYNEHPVNIELTVNGFDGVNWMDGFSRLPIPTEGDRIKTALAPRSRWWIHRE